jgi:oxygen-dependent protoporphyrinogen oxidase
MKEPNQSSALNNTPEVRKFRTLEGIIVGGGISGLALAHFLGLSENPEGWELWEAADRLGGTVGTDRIAGYSIDWGPNGFLDREPLTLRLVEEIRLSASLERAAGTSDKRFIARHGRLYPVPLSPWMILTTGLLSPVERLRVFAEPFIPRRRDPAEESVFDFAARRIGRGAAETFVDPMVSGVFGGLARQLSLPACFPVMREMEARYGGLVKALMARQLENIRSGGRRTAEKAGRGGPAGPAGRLTSFRTGLDAIVTRLQERLGAVVRTGRAAATASRKNGVWEVTDHLGLSSRAQRVILACPAFAAASILARLDRELASSLGEIPYAPIAVVASGHRREDIRHPLDGFGFLIPRSEGLRTLGSIWTSSVFADRAPAGHVQLRTMLGGAGDPAVMDLSDSRMWKMVRRELDPLVGITRDPVLLRIYRWERGIPQFTLGHLERRARIERLCARHTGLYLAGNAYYGVGLNDCVKMAYRIAREIKPD